MKTYRVLGVLLGSVLLSTIIAGCGAISNGTIEGDNSVVTEGESVDVAETKLVEEKVATAVVASGEVSSSVVKLQDEKLELDKQLQAEEEKKAKEKEEADRLAKEQAEKEAAKPKHIPGIICWGDSLTYGYKGDGVSYPGILQSLLSQNGYGDVKVVNVGSSGENSVSIAARSGGVPLVLASDATIGGGPEDSNSIIVQAAGKTVNMTAEVDVGINPCTIAGVEGKFWNGAIGAGSENVSYLFTRSSYGDPVAVPAGTPIIPYCATHYKDYVSIVFIGTNGGYSDYSDLISQQNAIINSRTANTGKYLIIGMFNAPGGYEDTMRAAYGDHFLSFPAYCGGAIPGDYWSDEIHLNGTGYAVLGQAVYERLVQLGSLDR